MFQTKFTITFKKDFIDNYKKKIIFMTMLDFTFKATTKNISSIKKNPHAFTYIFFK